MQCIKSKDEPRQSIERVANMTNDELVKRIETLEQGFKKARDAGMIASGALLITLGLLGWQLGWGIAKRVDDSFEALVNEATQQRLLNWMGSIDELEKRAKKLQADLDALKKENAQLEARGFVRYGETIALKMPDHSGLYVSLSPPANIRLGATQVLSDEKFQIARAGN